MNSSTDYCEYDEIYAKSDGETLIDHTSNVVGNVASTNSNQNSVVAACFHDLGKCSCPFQENIRRRMQDKNRQINEGSSTKNPQNRFKLIKEGQNWRFKRRGFRHEILSVIYLAILWKGNDEDFIKTADAILFHHKNPVFYSEDGFLIAKSPKRLFDFFSAVIEPKNDLIDWNVLITEFMKDLADSLRNNDGVFTFISELKEKCDECKVDYYIDTNIGDKIQERVDKAIGRIVRLLENAKTSLYSLTGSGNMSIDRDALNYYKFRGELKKGDYLGSAGVSNVSRGSTLGVSPEHWEKYNQALNDDSSWWQKQVIDDGSFPSNKKIYLLEAPTGSGKTFFAYYLWWKRFKKDRPYLVYILPVRAALNEKYYGDFKKEKVGLLHSSALSIFWKEKEFETSDANEISKKVALSRCYGVPIIYSTADQLLTISLDYFASDLYYPLFEKAFVVIDEPQAYTLEQMAIILKTVEITRELGGVTLIMSATMPTWLEDYLKNRFASEVVKICPSSDSIVKIEYDNSTNPVELNGSKVRNYSIARHKVEVRKVEVGSKGKGRKKSSNGEEDRKINEEKRKELSKTIKHIIEKEIKSWGDNKPNKILVVVNTVNQAIDVYEKLKSNESVYLLHSEFSPARKQEVFEKLSEESLILVGTQVVEAALDIDADLLITEISPMDSQIQRWGRVWRNRKSEYNKEKPNVIVLVPVKAENEPPLVVERVYEKKTIEVTYNILKSKLGNKTLDYSAEKALLSTYYHDLNSSLHLQQSGGEVDQQLVEMIKNIPFVSSQLVLTKEDAHKIFRADNLPKMDVVIKEEIENEIKKSGLLSNLFLSQILDDFNRFSSQQKIALQVIFEEHCYSIPQWDWEKIKNNVEVVGSLFGKTIISVSGEQLGKIQEFGLRRLAKNNKSKDKAESTNMI